MTRDANAPMAGNVSLLENSSYFAFLMDSIRSARTSFWTNVFSFNFRPADDGDLFVRSVARALVDAKRRGVDVRVLLGGNARRFLDLPAGNSLAFLFFSCLGVDCRYYDDAESHNSHAKYFVVDGKTLVCGSHNWSPRALSRGVDTAVAVESAGLAKAAQKIFRQAWKLAAPSPARSRDVVPGVPLLSTLGPVELYEQFRPESAAAKTSWSEGLARLLPDGAYATSLASAIRGAKRSIRVSMFFFSNPTSTRHPNYQIVGELLRAHGRGVDIRILLDADRKKDPYNSTRINTRVKDYLTKKGIAVRFDAPETVNHSKFAVFDEELLLLGSHNWTAGSLRRMHDVSLLVHAPEVAARCARLVDRHFRPR